MKLDHLAVAGASLEEAVSHVEEALGVAMGPGGQHPRYGTHNRLIGLDGGLYLEAIAVDPSVAPQEQPRWFDLDRFQGAARLSNWIVRAEDLRADCAVLPAPARRVVEMQRGDLQWLMTVPVDGILPFDNLCPAALQWLGTPPAGAMVPSGCRLQRLVLLHPQADDLRELVRALMADDRIVVERGAAAMQAEFMTPAGRRVLA